MATPSKATAALKAWKSDNWGWLTPADAEALARIIERLERDPADPFAGIVDVEVNDGWDA